MRLDRRLPALAALAAASALWITWPGAEHAGFAVALAGFAGLFVWRRERALGLAALAGAAIATSTFDGDGPRAWAAALLLLVPLDALLLEDRPVPRSRLPVRTAGLVAGFAAVTLAMLAWAPTGGLLDANASGTLTATLLVAAVGAGVAVFLRGDADLAG
ncbi:MAG TPA: hypothetical protein VM889_11920 [Candidatus Thermoplasmatota archaeon]|nr:hypothetical protein [Candidatus Thermoplasmatota archaeon]